MTTNRCWLQLCALAFVLSLGIQPVVRGQETKVQAAVSYELPGVWAGVAYLDEEKLKVKFDALQTEEQKEAFITKAESFLSAMAAFQFSAEGRFESDIELITTDGTTDRAKSFGTYRIVESKDAKFLVEMTEQTADAKTVQEKKLFQFYEDGQHLAILVPAPEEFADCNPLMVFERVPEEQLNAADESIAQQPSEGQIK